MKLGPLAVGLFVTMLSMVAAVDNAWAQACCTSTGSSEFAVVGRKDFAVIAAMVQYESVLGTFNRNGDYVAVERSVVRDVVFTPGFGIRPVPKLQRWQLNLAVPLRYQYRWLDKIPASSSFGFGDMSVSTRFTVLEDPVTGIRRDEPNSFLPYIDLILSVKAPTGRSPEESVEPSGSDAMGDGSWNATVGIAIQKFFTRKSAISLGFDYEMRFPHQVSDAGTNGSNSQYDPGNATNYRAALQYVPNFDWNAAIFTSLRVIYPSKLDDEVVENSQVLRWRMGMSFTWVFAYPKWEAMVAAMTDPWWHGGGWNVTAAGTAVMLQFRRNFSLGSKTRESKPVEIRPNEIEAPTPMAFDSPPPIGTKAMCPVMKEQFVVMDGSERSEYNGKHYVYCCPGCKAKFDALPGKYID